MKKTFTYLFFILLSVFVTSCGSSSKKTATSKKKSNVSSVKKKPNPNDKKIKSIVSYAKSFGGTKYKYGGTTKKGMDCSGLVYTSFKKENVVLPRTSRTMATQGKSISLNKVKIGDLLFFKTNKRKNVISHVGIVVQVKGGIKFIHSSTSRGVIVSALEEKYWNKAYALARRIL